MAIGDRPVGPMQQPQGYPGDRMTKEPKSLDVVTLESALLTTEGSMECLESGFLMWRYHNDKPIRDQDGDPQLAEENPLDRQVARLLSLNARIQLMAMEFNEQIYKRLV